MNDECEATNEHPSAQDRVGHGQDGWAKLTSFVIPAFIAVLVAMAGQGLYAWRGLAVLDTRHAELAAAFERHLNSYAADTATLATLAREVHGNSLHRSQHEREAERWIDKILENEHHIESLRTDAAARKDPFTGTEGAELRRRIDGLEQRERGRP